MNKQCNQRKYTNDIRYVKNIIPVFLLLFIIPSVTIFVQARDNSPFVQIPFELKSSYVAFSLPIEPSGTLSLLFDTGCQTTTIVKDVLRDTSRRQAITLLLGSHKLKIENYHISPRTVLSKAHGQTIDGVIGNDLLHRYTVRIDHKNRLLSLFDSEELITYPTGDSVEIEVNS